MNIILCDLNREITDQWEYYFNDVANVRIFCGDFRKLPERYPDETFVMTSAGNSYGIMGGGLDLAIAKWTPGIEEHIRDRIEHLSHGELGIGQSIGVRLEPGARPFKFLIYTPTMIAPVKLRDGSSVYFATKAGMRAYAMLRESFAEEFYNSTLVLPGFGGSCGGLPAFLIARCMKLAYKRFTEARIPQNEEEMAKQYREFYETCRW